jgi:hypothetical protein
MATSGLLLMSPLALNGAEAKRKTADISFVEPLIGHVFDEGTRQIRTILGIPGAARVAEAIPLETPLRDVVIGAGGKLAVASVENGESAVLIRPSGTPAIILPISGSMKVFNVAVFSPSGTAAILFGSECNCLQVASSFEESPAVTRVVDASALPGEITALAIADDASFAAVAVSSTVEHAPAAQLLLVDLKGDAPPRLLLNTTVSAVAFSLEGNDLAVADAKTHSLSLIRDVRGDATVTSVAGESDGLAMPSAVTFLNATTVLIADRSGLVHVANLEGAQLRTISCYCRPNAVELMELKSTYRLTGTETGAVWIVSLTESDAAVRFVPVDSADESETTQTESAQ